MTRRSQGHDRLKAVGALALLVAFVIGIPLALIGVATRTPLASGADLSHALTQPDDGRLFITAIVGVAWLGWALFTTAVIVEIVAVVRDAPTPHLPALRSLQQNAAALVAAAGILFAAGHPVGLPSPRPAAAIVQTELTRTATTTTQQQLDAQAVSTPLPTVVVKRHDTLWSLAEQHLGSGERFREIVYLNLGVQQADGRALSSSHWIFPGWVLSLPSVSGEQVVPQPGAQTYLVQPGDSLSEIAKNELGDASKAGQIFSLNEGTPMPGGSALADPDVIRPDLILELPKPGPGASQKTSELLVPNPPPVLPPVAPPSAPPDRAPVPVPAVGPAPESHPPASAISSETLEAGATLALGLATATGLVHELRRRRKQQQRIRPAGGRIPMPEPEAARVEQLAAALEAPVTVESAIRALRSLAAACKDLDRALPDVLLVRLTPTSLRLQLATEESEAVSPFVAEDRQTWRLNDHGVESHEEDPYPALLTLGVDGPELVLLNLESVGSLHVTDPEGDATRAMLLDLAVGPLCTGAGLVFAEDRGELAAVLDPLRCAVLRGSESVADEVSSRLQKHLQAFGENAALRRHMLPEGLPATIVIGSDCPETQDLAGSGIAVLALGGSGGEDTRVVVESATRAVLLPLGFEFEPQLLKPDGFAQVTRLLASSQGQTPAPEEPDVRVAVARALREVPATLLDLRDDGSPPRLLVLGRVHVEHADDAAAPHRRRRASELVAYLALHPEATGREIEEALWPGKRVEKSTRNPFISRTRQWLGKGPDGEPYLPLVVDGGLYRLRPEVSCDWHDFVRFSQLGLDSGTPGASALSAALDLVRGRPFLGVDPTTYTWAESDIQEMISAIVDVAHVLADMRLEAGDFRGAQQAVARGLLAEPCSEVLYRDAMKAAIATGDLKELDRLSGRLRSEITLIDPDETFDEETIELLSKRSHLTR